VRDINETSEEAAYRFMERVRRLIPKSPADRALLLYGMYAHPDLDAQMFFVLCGRAGQHEMLSRIAAAVATVVVSTAAHDAGVAEPDEEHMGQLVENMTTALALSLAMNVEALAEHLKKRNRPAERAEDLELDPKFQEFIQQLFDGSDSLDD